ncbi:hypothetical protein PVBG_06290, partial [Plasmodium vivax Brazil I]
KLDCYCEKKIFAKIDDICEFARKTKNEKKRFKKIGKKYGLPYCLSVLYIFIALIITIIDISDTKWLWLPKNPPETIYKTFCYILFVVIPIIIFLVLSYITIKIRKYDRLVEGKVEGKMFAKKISCYYDD